MASARPIDTLDLSPRWSPADVARLNDRFAKSDASDLLKAVLGDGLLGRVAVVSSFGAESAVLLDLVAAVDPATPVLFLDTGRHFAETLAYRDTLAARLGLSDVRVIAPDPAEIAKRDAAGERWSYDPDGCCDIRKVRPLARALAGFDASITGRKAFQAATRAALPPFELDGERLKCNPLIAWSKDRLDAHAAARDLPRHPLLERGYGSIGCAPCTSTIRPGEDPRAGRWRGFAKTECGIHTSDVGAAAAARG
ncbi:phosphoadenylylsulfate reductase (thioredoxin) [Sphingomonas guangdongensis]|uniref:Adenosine 5'-phosphosulfate reductase n=1 Tax=Sphingomonas guangdongensis TaxID=1141890 RepID=A0A285R181_9SPHN|nr:phosphoadenylyl-sulfate reductase [Sphingomonas guangdongensis]SOB87584.1 phosphoadenylylsulfate reductase (thioredoxin) [Sphingomonas guangdongensis]